MRITPFLYAGDHPQGVPEVSYPHEAVANISLLRPVALPEVNWTTIKAVLIGIGLSPSDADWLITTKKPAH